MECHPLEPFDAARDRWPERIQPVVEACWDKPAIIRLLQGAAAAGFPPPLHGTPGARNDRQRALGDARIQQLLVEAAREGVSVRTLAAVLFATTPGKASDDIARTIDARDQTARTARRR